MKLQMVFLSLLASRLSHHVVEALFHPRVTTGLKWRLSHKTDKPEVSKNVSIIPGDNSQYIEGLSQYIWIPDGDEVPRLVNLRQPASVHLHELGAHHNEYLLFTRSNKKQPQYIIPGDVWSIFRTNYETNLPLMVIVHGWLSDSTAGVNELICKRALEKDNINVIVVNWGTIAKNPIYPTASSWVPTVGRLLGEFLDWLIKTTNGSWDLVHLVGFSLGAHVVGNAGRTVGGKPARITGLDPAGPLWYNNEKRLWPSDGKYVEVIHTDAGVAGMSLQLGHVDFFPNQGQHPQPGCFLHTCSHSRAYHLFAATIEHNHLIGHKCSHIFEAKQSHCKGNEILRMGNMNLNKKGSGLFNLVTDRFEPF